MVKITLRAEPMDWDDSRGRLEPGTMAQRFRDRFGAFLPDQSDEPLRNPVDFAYLIQRMLQIAAQQALPSATSHTFQIVSSFAYSDSARSGMFTLTGIVCDSEFKGAVVTAYRSWGLANLGWKKPRKIDVPTLSTKERLHLQAHLPCSGLTGRRLRQKLGYSIDSTWQATEARLSDYAEFARYLPYFMRATP